MRASRRHHRPRRAAAYAEHPDPTAADGQVLVRVTAAPVVPLDLLCASGTSYFGPPALPYVPGVQGVGVTDVRPSGCGSSSSAGMKPGDGTLGRAGARSRTPTWSRSPATSDDARGRGLGLSGVAAWLALNLRAARAGRRAACVVLGAGGAVGQVAVAVAAAAGRRPGGRRLPRAAGVDRARRNGADEVVAAPGDRRRRDAGRPADRGLDGTGATWSSTRCSAGGRGGRAGHDAGRAAGQPRRLGRRRGHALVGRDPRQVPRRARLHQQRPHPRAAGRGPDAGARAGRPRTTFVEHVVRPLAEITEAWTDVAAGSGPSGAGALTSWSAGRPADDELGGQHGGRSGLLAGQPVHKQPRGQLALVPDVLVDGGQTEARPPADGRRRRSPRCRPAPRARPGGWSASAPDRQLVGMGEHRGGRGGAAPAAPPWPLRRRSDPQGTRREQVGVEVDPVVLERLDVRQRAPVDRPSEWRSGRSHRSSRCGGGRAAIRWLTAWRPAALVVDAARRGTAQLAARPP